MMVVVVLVVLARGSTEGAEGRRSSRPVGEEEEEEEGALPGGRLGRGTRVSPFSPPARFGPARSIPTTDRPTLVPFLSLPFGSPAMARSGWKWRQREAREEPELPLLEELLRTLLAGERAPVAAAAAGARSCSWPAEEEEEAEKEAAEATPGRSPRGRGMEAEGRGGGGEEAEAKEGRAATTVAGRRMMRMMREAEAAVPPQGPRRPSPKMAPARGPSPLALFFLPQGVR
uniref:Uncharacterized protein n=1 Tax=Pogona vitticeps TaxID=103695 RepID=A0ABM5EPP1_9SAUR